MKRVLLLEPREDSEAIAHLLRETRDTKNDVVQNILLTKDAAVANDVAIKYHNEMTSLSFMICDPAPSVEGEVVEFSKRAYVIAQVPDRNLLDAEWSVYKKGKTTSKYAFDGYVKWFQQVWDDRSQPVTDLSAPDCDEGRQGHERTRRAQAELHFAYINSHVVGSKPPELRFEVGLDSTGNMLAERAKLEIAGEKIPLEGWPSADVQPGVTTGVGGTCKVEGLSIGPHPFRLLVWAAGDWWESDRGTLDYSPTKS